MRQSLTEPVQRPAQRARQKTACISVIGRTHKAPWPCVKCKLALHQPKFAHMNFQPASACAQALLLCAAAWLAPAAWAQPCPEQAQVGRLGTVIGLGHIHAGAHSRPAERGAGVCVGERIETSASGHIHIRFVDGALVSVRPSSRLLIEAYPLPAAPERAAAAGPVHFRLEVGVVRSVSGEFGRAQREQFRIKTPLAAIGIRGTDFIVHSDASGTTRATVVSGAIVVAPLLGECALVPQRCPEQALTLSADMGHLMIELSRAHPLPRLLPALDLLAGRGTVAGAATVADSAPHAPLPDQRPALEASAQLATGQGAAQEGAALDPAPDGQLLWVHRVGMGAGLPPHTLSQRFDAALVDGLSPAIGNFSYTLYRNERSQPHFAPQASSASFVLRQGQAHFYPTQSWVRQPEVVQVERGQLQVDFANARFATQLDLRSPSVNTRFAAQGQIDAMGYFRSFGQGHALGGAFSTDGRQAGYFFNQTLPDGRVSGLTLWGR